MQLAIQEFSEIVQLFFPAPAPPAITDAQAKATRTPRQKRLYTLDPERRSRLRTLENDLLFGNMLRKLEALNPEGFDPEIIDRTLEPDEAINDIKRRYPAIVTDDAATDLDSDLKEFLTAKGLTNPLARNVVLYQLECGTFTEVELQNIGAALADFRMLAVS